MTSLTKLIWLPDFIFHPYAAMPYSRATNQKNHSKFYQKSAAKLISRRIIQTK